MKKILSLLMVSMMIMSSLSMSFADSKSYKNDLDVKVETISKDVKNISRIVTDQNYSTRSELHEETETIVDFADVYKVIKVANVKAGTVTIASTYTYTETWLVNNHGTKVDMVKRSPKKIVQTNIDYDAIIPFQMWIDIYDEGIGGSTARLVGNVSSPKGGTKSFRVELNV